MTQYAGIDPGLTGAVGILDHNGRLVSVVDTPTIAIRKGKTTKHDYLPSQMASILAGKDVRVALEFVSAMPRQGVTSVFSFGRGTGIWEGILGALELPYCKVTPQAWKRALIGVGTGSNKAASILRAQQLIPGAASYLTLKKHEGRAEALLIALWMYQHRAAGLAGDGGLVMPVARSA
jgi:crossover junction endodeoxyribonuclease RuvC